MPLAEIAMPLTRGVMPVVDVPLLDALLVPETERDAEVGVTTVVDWSEVESGGMKRGAWVVRLFAEDEIGRTDGKVTVGGGTEGSKLVVDALVGAGGLKMLEIKDSIGFNFSSADEDEDEGEDEGDVGCV